MSESTQTNLRQRLRSATKDSHAQLDGAMGLHPPFASAENYCRYLCGMDRLYQHCDASMQWVEEQTKLTSHSTPLRDLIRHDIESLKLLSEPELPVPAGLPAATTPATHWGRAYVMEGSSMGATFLVKQAEKELSDSFGMSFLQQLSSDAKHRWSIFAEALAVAEANADEAAAAAVGVFEYAYQIFGD